MTLEFQVASHFGQVEHIEKVMVEECGMLLWTEIPQHRLEISELPAARAQTAAETDLGPFWDAELQFKSITVTIRGLEVHSTYSFRLAVANEVGWGEKSEIIEARTVHRPEALQLFKAPGGPFELRVYWDQKDPLGGLVDDWEPQICETSLFSSWSPADNFLILRQPSEEKAPSFIVWEAAFCCLKPNCEYFLRLRAGNVAGWSEWSEPLRARTPGPPGIARCLLKSGGEHGSLVEVELTPSSRALVCLVELQMDGQVYQTLARRARNGFRAAVPSGTAASVAVSNVAGTSGAHAVREEVKLPRPQRLTAAVPEALEALRCFLAAETQDLREVQQDVTSLVADAKRLERWTPPMLHRIELRERSLKAIMDVLGCWALCGV